MNKGYIPISRGLFEHPFWCEERCYSRFEAWVYLIQDVRFEDTKLYLANTVFVVKRGQTSVSLRYLAKAWGWSTKKVKYFLELLQTDKMITFETPKETGQTLITISKYDIYNKINIDKETPKETQRKHSENSTETNRKKENKVNNEKERENEVSTIIPPLPDSRYLNSSSGTEEISSPFPPVPLTVSEQNFIKFQQWILTNAPQVAEFKEPFTLTQFEKLKKDFSLGKIQDMLMRMHNKVDLTKKNRNANRTFQNWISIELKHTDYANNTGSNKGTTRANIPTTTNGYTSTLSTTIDD